MVKTLTLLVVAIAGVGVLFYARAPAYEGPVNGTASCRDGTISYSADSAACAPYGGVAGWNGASLLDRMFHRHTSARNRQPEPPASKLRPVMPINP